MRAEEKFAGKKETFSYLSSWEMMMNFFLIYGKTSKSGAVRWFSDKFIGAFKDLICWLNCIYF